MKWLRRLFPKKKPFAFQYSPRPKTYAYDGSLAIGLYDGEDAVFGLFNTLSKRAVDHEGFITDNNGLSHYVTHICDTKTPSCLWHKHKFKLNPTRYC